MWLRDLQLSDGRPRIHPGIASDLDLFAIEIVDLYLGALRRKVRTGRTAKVVVTLSPPAVLSAPRLIEDHVAVVDWPCDVDGIERADDRARRRLLLDALHDGLSALAVACGWAPQPLADARQAAIDAGLILEGRLLVRPLPSPDRKTGVTFAYRYVDLAVVAFVVILDPRGTETSRVELLRTSPGVELAKLVTHVAWQGNRRVNVRSRSTVGTAPYVVRLGPPLTVEVATARTRTLATRGSTSTPTSRTRSSTRS